MFGGRPSHTPTVKSVLLTQLGSNQKDKDLAYDSIVDLAKKLDITKQIAFINNIARAYGLANDPAITAIDGAYQQYCYDPNGVESYRKEYNEKKAALFLKASQLKQQPDETKKERKEVADQLKQLDKKYKKKMGKYYDKAQKPSMKAALAAAYAKCKGHLATTINWNEQLIFLFQNPPGYPGDFYNAPVPRVVSANKKNPNNPSKLELRKAYENDPQMEHGLFMGLKEGGANSPGEFGHRGIRSYLDNSGRLRWQVVFNKQATDDCMPNHRENIAEVIASRLMSTMIGDYAASAYLALKPGGQKGNPDDIYVASIYFDNLTEIHKAALLRTAIRKFKKAHNDQEPTDEEKAQLEAKLKQRVYGRVAGKGSYAGQDIDSSFFGHPDFRPGSLELMQDTTIEQTSQGKTLMASLLMGNDQIHGDNTGLASFPGDTKSWAYAILDFGGAFRRPYTNPFPGVTYEKSTGRFSSIVTPEETSNKKYKTAYFLSYPPELRRSEDFIKGLDAVAEFDFQVLAREIDETINYVIEYYGEAGFAEHFAKDLDTDNAKLADPNTVRAETKKFLKEVLFARQLSLRDYSIAKKLESIQENPHNKFVFNDLIHDHPFYFIMKDQHKNTAVAALDAEAADDRFIQFLKGPTGIHFDEPDSIPETLLAFMQIADDCIDPKDAVLSYQNKELQSCLFAARDDKTLLPKACDEAYHLLRTIYYKLNENSQAYFLSALAQETIMEAPVVSFTSLENLLSAGQPEALSTVFDGATLSMSLQTAVRQDLLGEDCCPPNIQQPVDKDHPFIQSFYLKVADLAFDASGSFQPWLVKQLGYPALNNAIKQFGADQVKLQIFNALHNRLLQEVVVEANGNDDLREFIDKQARPFIEGHTASINQYAQQISNLKQLKNIRHSSATEQALSHALANESKNLKVVFTHPLVDIQTFIDNLQGLQLNDLVREEREISHEIISSEFLPPPSAHVASSITPPPAPLATVAGDPSQTSDDGPQSKHHLTFHMKNKHKIKVEIMERRTHASQKPLSHLTELPEDLDINSILGHAAHQKFPQLAIFADLHNAKDFFRMIIPEMKERDHTLSEQGFLAALQAAEPHLGDAELKEIADTLFGVYKNSTEQMTPHRGWYYPNDILIRTALHQVETYIKFSQKANPRIVISNAWDPHYVEAVLLVCSLKDINCECDNKSKWTIENLEGKKAEFADFYTGRYLGVKVNTEEKITAQLSKSPHALHANASGSSAHSLDDDNSNLNNANPASNH